RLKKSSAAPGFIRSLSVVSSVLILIGVSPNGFSHPRGPLDPGVPDGMIGLVPCSSRIARRRRSTVGGLDGEPAAPGRAATAGGTPARLTDYTAPRTAANFSANRPGS